MHKIVSFSETATSGEKKLFTTFYVFFTLQRQKPLILQGLVPVGQPLHKIWLPQDTFWTTVYFEPCLLTQFTFLLPVAQIKCVEYDYMTKLHVFQHQSTQMSGGSWHGSLPCSQPGDIVWLPSESSSNRFPFVLIAIFYYSFHCGRDLRMLLHPLQECSHHPVVIFRLLHNKQTKYKGWL